MIADLLEPRLADFPLAADPEVGQTNQYKRVDRE
jgi:hypothetical protein